MPSVDVYYSTPRDKDPSELSCQATCDNFNDEHVNGGPAGAAAVTTYAYRNQNTVARFTTNVAGNALETYLTNQYQGYTVVAV